MGKIGDTLQSLLPFLKKKKNVDSGERKPKKRGDGEQEDDEDEEDEDEDEEEPIGAVSMNEGTHEKIFGIRREVVKGIGAFFAVVLLAALFLAPGSNEPQEGAMGDGFAQADEKDIAKKKSATGKDETNDYGALIESNKRKAEMEAAAARNSQAEGQVPSQAQPATVAATPPAIPRVSSVPAVSPVPQASVPASAPQASTQAPAPEKEDTRYSSAISFSFGAGNSQMSSAEPTGEGEGGTGNGTQASSQPGAVDSMIASSASPVTATSTALTPRSLAIGTIIPVRLMTGINTDSPGQVMAMVLSDVMDSLTGQTVLIPAGSKLFGVIDGGQGKGNGTSNGRVSLTFPTVLTPDNRSFSVGSAFQAMDGAGYSGVKGKLKKHTAARFSSGIFAAGIAALGSLAAGNTNGTSNTYSAGQLASQGALASLINQTTGLLQSSGNISPTTTVKPGYEFSIYVTQNIQF